jgi:poly(3-hydroxybutyrate) depolymerase
MNKCLAFFLAGELFSLLTAAASELRPGSGEFAFGAAGGNRNRPITVWYHRPADLNAGSPIVLVSHGVNRNGREYRDSWVEQARSRKFLLICPEFGAQDYPTRAFQQGNVVDAAGQTVSREQWTYSTIEVLFDFVKKTTGSAATNYHLYGHSAGGQSVQRLVLLMPNARYARAIAANPGWYTMPAFDVRYPYGLQQTGVTKVEVAASFRRDFVLLLGEEDTGSENLRQTPEAMAQGKTRIERGQNYYAAARKAAATLNVPCAWRLKTVPGAGHSNRQLAATAAAALFDGAK